MTDKNDAALKFLLRGANQGDIRAAYQLYLNYKIGIFTDKNEKLEIEYLNNVAKIASNQRLTANEITLNDFRGLHQASIKLDKKITVIVGNNGHGKTSILDALAYSLSWLRSNIQNENRPGTPIRELDINNSEYSKYASITTRFSFCKKSFTVMLSKSKELSSDRKTNSLQEIKALAGIFRDLRENQKKNNLPLVAYYPIARSTEGAGIDSRRTINREQTEWTEVNAYEDVLNDRHDFAEFFKWYIFLNNAANQKNNNDSQKYIELQNNIKLHIQAIESLSKLGTVSPEVINSLDEQLKKHELELAEIDNENRKKLIPDAKKLIDTINKALLAFLPDFDNINISYTNKNVRILLRKKNLDLDVSQLSQGEKTILTLVGDISRRLALLNHDSRNPLHGNGIVLIDEIDMHLHPVWQQNIIKNLIDTFPNLQLIVTTHSPQVLSTIDAKSIRILNIRDTTEDERNAITISSPEFQTKGVKSSQVLEQVMLTDSIPPVDEAAWLDEYKKLIELNEQETESAAKLQNDIVAHFGSSHPLVLELKNLIAIQKMKQKLESRRMSKESNKNA